MPSDELEPRNDVSLAEKRQLSSRPAADSRGQDVVSPELALVSPELADSARRDLRPRAVVDPRRPGPGRAGARSDGGAEGSLARSRPAGNGRRFRGLSRPQIIAAALVAGVLVTGALAQFWPGDRDGGAPRPVADEGPLASGKPGGRAPLVANGGYVVSPGGSFVTGDSGRSIETFTLPLRCGSVPLVVEDIPLRGQVLRFSGTAAGGATTVHIRAQVRDRSNVQGVVSADGASCPAGAVSFSARLS
jgi:hypothetical protein